MRYLKKAFRRALALLLICALALAALPALAENELRSAYQETQDAMLALYAKEKTFVYNGQEYPLEEGLDIANSVFWETDDYYPFCDALLAENLRVSAEMGALFLKYIDILNQYAIAAGYKNYKEYAEREQYHYTYDTSAVFGIIRDNYPRSMPMLLSYRALESYVNEQVSLPQQAYIDGLIARYGQMSADFVPILTELVASPRFSLEKVGKAYVGGETSLANGICFLSVRYDCDSFLVMALAHEMGHYLQYEQVKEWIKNTTIAETHSIGGALLCADYVQAQYEALMGKEWAAVYMMQYIYGQLGSLCLDALLYELATDIILRREEYTPEMIGEKYLELSLSLGFDGGFSPDYQMLVGCNWCENPVFLRTPLYSLSYSVAACNAVALWRDQEVKGTGIATYVPLLGSATPIEEPYADYCARFGLLDFFAPGAHAGLDDFLADKLLSYERIAFGE